MCSLSARAARAEGARILSPTCGSTAGPVVQVVLVALPATVLLRESICEWFDDEPWRIRFVAAEAGGAVDLPAVDATSPTLAITQNAADVELTLTASSSAALGPRQAWTRHIALEHGLDDAGVEVVAQAVHSTVQAWRERQLDETPRPPVPAAQPTPGAAAASAPEASTPPEPVVARASSRRAERSLPPRSGPHLPVHTGLTYSVHARGKEAPTHGPGLQLELDWADSGVVLSTFVNAAVFTSGYSRRAGLALSMSGTALTTGVAASLPLGVWRVRLAAAGGVELLELAVRSDDRASLQPLADQTPAPRWWVGTETGAALRFGPLELRFSALLRWQLLATHYDILSAGDEVTIGRPWRLQPGALLAVAYVW
jgi:hypothetical protein